jgi:hypothetical protein
VSDPTLSRHAGVIALAAGAVFVATDLGRYPLNDNRLAMATDPLLMAVNAAYFFAFVGLMIALLAVHGRLAVVMGRFGMVAFLAAVLGVMTQGGNMWFDGFAAPWLAEVLPQAFTARKTSILQIGGLSSYVLFALGWVLYGLATLRAKALPVALSVALVVGGLLGYNSGLPPYGTPIGLAVAALGGWLVHQDRAARLATV